MTERKPALMGMDMDGLTDAVTQAGLEKFRARQLRDWLLKGAGFDGMRNLPAKAIGALAKRYVIGGATIDQVFTSQRDGTEKYLFALQDGQVVEGVALRYEHGNTLCLSTQVGCRMGCVFCVSGKNGLIRNLEPGEMLGQVVAANARLGGGRAIANLVLMGSGEPLDNYDNTVAFLRLVTAEDGMNIGRRNISLSTCGLPPGICRLAEEGLGVTLCISLHSPFDAQRRQIMPAANAYTVAEVVDAARNYGECTGRRVIYEYALMDGFNDRPQDAEELARLLRGQLAHVNVIALNPGADSAQRPSHRVQAFIDALQKQNVSATRRRTLGEDIGGACGQLKSKTV